MRLTPMRRRLLRIFAWVLGLGLAYLIWLLITGLPIPCPFYEWTGLPCPGCGTTRMFLSLARLDLTAAFRYHPVMLFGLFLWCAVALALWAGKPKGCASPRFLYSLLALTSASLLIFGVARMLP